MRTLILAVVALFVGRGAAQADVEPWRVVRDLDLRGTHAVAARVLVSGLMLEPEVQKLLTERIDEAAMTCIAAVIGRIYRRNGFGESVVTGSLRSGRGVIEIEEGPRRTCGVIRCVGDSAVASAAIVARLQPRGRGFRGWQPGEPAATDDAFLLAAATIVQEQCVDAGRLDARVTVRAEPRDDVVDLVVAFEDAGHRVRVQSLELVGERAVDHAAVLACLQWKPGDVVDAGWLARLREQLDALGRYREIRIQLPTPAPDTLDPLRVEVEVVSHAPPLAALDAPAVEAVRRGLARVVAHIEGGHLVRYRCTFDDAMTVVPGLRVLPGTLTMDVSRAGWRAALPNLEVGGRPTGPFEMILTPESLALEVAGLHANCAFASALQVSAKVSTHFEPDGTCLLGWSVEFRPDGAPSALTVQVHPATASFCVHGPGNTHRREGEDLVLTFDDSELRLGADGELRTRRIDFQTDGLARSLELVDATFADLRSTFQARHPAAVASVGEFLAAFASEQVSGLPDAELGEGVRVTALLRGAVLGLQAIAQTPNAMPEQASATPARPFAFPASTSAVTVPGALLGLAAQPWLEGWAADLLGALATLSLSRADAAAECLLNYRRNEDHGPIAMLLAARFLDHFGVAVVSRSFAGVAAQRWSFDAVYRDLAAVLDDIPQLADLPRAIGAAWRQQEELAALFPPVPPDSDPDLAAWRAGLEDLWRGGLGESLRGLLFAGK